MTVLIIDCLNEVPNGSIEHITVLYWNLKTAITMPLPAKLRELHCDYVTELPAKIPNTVTLLQCDSVESLPGVLPAGLTRLSCNSVKQMPELPSSIRSLSCNKALTVTASKPLPDLKWLSCNMAVDIAIDSMPYLEVLHCGEHLSNIPKSKGLVKVHYAPNTWTEEQMEAA